MRIRRLDTRTASLAEIARAVRRPALSEMPVPEPMRAALERHFGPGVTAVEAVRRIVESVRTEGDRALVRWSLEFDGVELEPESFYLGSDAVEAARHSGYEWCLPHLQEAARAIERFHRLQVPAPSLDVTPEGAWAAWMARPVRRAAVYVPAGTAPLASTALMGVVPARVAGVGEIVVVTPPPAHPGVVLAAFVAGAHRVLQLGGAQAVAALAYGTETVQPADVVVGPGNLFVQLAKREVVGVVGIDGLAGPTEVVVLADRTAPAPWVAADLLAQAEHAPDAAAILITDSPQLADAVEEELARQLQALPRASLARASLSRWGAVVVCGSLATEGVLLADAIAPEHVQVMAQEAQSLAARLTAAGAILVGAHTPEALADYAAGTNHILPTNATARFASAVGVHTFLRWSAVLMASPAAAAHLYPVVEALGTLEGLEAHVRSARMRVQGQRGADAQTERGPAGKAEGSGGARAQAGGTAHG